VGEPEGLNTQGHSEQPKPRERFSSIHTSLLGICLLALVCDMRHSSSDESLGEETDRGEEPTKLDIDSALRLSTGGVEETSGLKLNWVGLHRSSYARDVLHYTVTLVMLVRATTVQNRPDLRSCRGRE
jgi:hypothetical protein